MFPFSQPTTECVIVISSILSILLKLGKIAGHLDKLTRSQCKMNRQTVRSLAEVSATEIEEVASRNEKNSRTLLKNPHRLRAALVARSRTNSPHQRHRVMHRTRQHGLCSCLTLKNGGTKMLRAHRDNITFTKAPVIDQGDLSRTPKLSSLCVDASLPAGI